MLEQLDLGIEERQYGGPVKVVLRRWWAGVDIVVRKRIENAISRELIRKERLRAQYREAARAVWSDRPKTPGTPPPPPMPPNRDHLRTTATPGSSEPASQLSPRSQRWARRWGRSDA